MTTSPVGGTASAQQPQPLNSFPPGAAVNAPLSQNTGVVGTTATSPDTMQQPVTPTTRSRRTPRR